MKLKKATALAMAMATVATMGAIPAFAATNGNTAVNIEAKATTMNVNVPSTAAFVFNADGTNVVPTNFTITNNSKISGIHVTSIALTSADADKGWKLLPESANVKTQAVNTKNIKMTINNKPVVVTGTAAATTGTATYEANDIAIASEGTTTLKFGVERGSFTTAVASGKAFDMVTSFAFN